MLKRIRPLYGTALLLACLVSGARADNLTLVNAGANAAMGGVYTSPYTVSVNGTPTLLICDDFTTDVSLGQNWTASATTLTTVTSATIAGLKFAGQANAAQNYVTAAILAAELMTLPNIGTPAEDQYQAGILSFALWGVFDAPLLQSTAAHPTGDNPYGALTQAQFDAANLALTAARGIAGGITDLSQISVNGQSIASLTVYTPNPLGSSQEFLRVSMPEPSFPAVLAVDLLAVVGLIAILRRRSAALN